MKVFTTSFRITRISLRPGVNDAWSFFAKKRLRNHQCALNTDFDRLPVLSSAKHKCKVPSFEEVIRCVLTDEGFEDNRYLESFASYDLVKPFWQQCELLFGYADENPTLEKLVMTTFVTYAQKVIRAPLPAAWQPFVSFKSGNCIAFLDNLMNSVLYADRFDALSADIFRKLDAGNAWEKLGAEALADCNLFVSVDDIVLKWMIDRLLGEDYSARLNGNGIQALCEARRRMHFGKASENAYNAIENALLILSEHKYEPKSDVNVVIQYYLNDGWKIDACYRRFILAIDRLEGSPLFEPLQDLVQRVYEERKHRNGYAEHQPETSPAFRWPYRPQGLDENHQGRGKRARLCTGVPAGAVLLIR